MKGNLMVRLLSTMIIGSILAAYFTGQIDLAQPTWIWLTLFAGVNAFQSTFTGFCPVEKFVVRKKEA